MAKNPVGNSACGIHSGGATEIRTRDTLLAYTRFPGVPLQPLEHRSFSVLRCEVNAFIWIFNDFCGFFYYFCFLNNDNY